MRHCVQFSGGVSSWAAARVVADTLAAPGDDIVLLFADTLIEDQDTYAFLDAAAADIGVPLTRLADGRDIWQVFKDKRFLGNSRIDPCSQILKRKLLRAWINEHCDPTDSVIYLGIDWTEEHRLSRARPRWEPYRVEAPLTTDYRPKAFWLEEAARRGLPKQRLYEMGMPHANCGGGCVKAGEGHFARLLEVFPERFAEWEANEESVRQHLGRTDIAILRRRGEPMTLRQLREKREANQQIDLFDIGGCGCAID